MPEVTSIREGRVLDFDIENRPLSYWYDGNPTAEVTAIAWSFDGDRHVVVNVLDPPPEHLSSLRTMLENFRAAYDEADVVTGHYIRGHDLPILNGAMLELGLPALSPKRTSDTKLDLTRRGGLPATQEYLGALMGTSQQKIPMTQEDWRSANRLDPKGVEGTVRRVHADVVQHKELRQELLRRGLLSAPRIWRP